MALHGFENFNPGNNNVANFGGQPQSGAFKMPQLGGYNAMPDNFGQGGLFEANNPMAGLKLDFATDPAAQAGQGDLMRMMFGGKNADGSSQMGAVTGGLGAIAGIGNAVLGYKQYGLAKKELAFQKDQARINNQNQMTSLNNLMRGGAQNDFIATGGQTLSGEDYVAKHGMKL